MESAREVGNALTTGGRRACLFARSQGLQHGVLGRPHADAGSFEMLGGGAGGLLFASARPELIHSGVPLTPHTSHLTQASPAASQMRE